MTTDSKKKWEQTYEHSSNRVTRMISDGELTHMIEMLDSGKEVRLVLDDSIGELEFSATGHGNFEVTILPNWYEAVYCANNYIPETLRLILEQFAKAATIMERSSAATKFSVEWW
jgi:hypothetical protein